IASNASDQPDIYSAMGICYDKLGQYSQAIEAYESALKLAPRPDIYNNLGIVLDKIGSYPEAELAYREALNIQKDYKQAVFNLANIYKKQKKTGAARELYKNFIETIENETDRSEALQKLRELK
ncbi:MAG TPA: tetratricopeptide repeat protein, partial [bacterium]|nr:tetratricopeptide repeat protein [bacterium]